MDGVVKLNYKIQHWQHPQLIILGDRIIQLGCFLKYKLNTIFNYYIKNCKYIYVPWPGKPVFFFHKNYFYSMKRLWGLAQNIYGRDKIGLVTLPQKENGGKIDESQFNTWGSEIVQKLCFINLKLNFRFIKWELACVVFNDMEDLKKKTWLKFNRWSSHLKKAIVRGGSRIRRLKFILFSFLHY